jgi:WD40 repeat protein
MDGPPKSEHRTPKPDVPKVTDFGLAKRLDSATGQTQSGAILGTPQYMAPEQAAGKSKRVGPATDIYALGAILYELVTGRPPFQGETPLETILQVSRDEPVSPRLLNPALPRDLETIVLKCLQKTPDRRYETAEALADDLVRFLDDQPISARPAGAVERARAWMRRHPTVTALLAVTFVAAATLLAVGYRSHRALAEAYTQVSDQRDRAMREEKANHRRMVELTVANGARRADDGDLLLALPWYAEALKLDAEDPDRATVHRLRLAAALAPCPRLAAAWEHFGRVTDVAFRPDGKAVATAGEYGTVHVWNPDRPGERPRSFERLPSATQLAYRPDGGRLLIVSGNDVYIWNPAGGRETPKLSQPAAVNRAVWTPDGRHVLTACADGLARLWDAETAKATGIEFRHAGGVTAIAISRDGTRVATGGADGTARVWDLATGDAISPSITARSPIKVVAFGPDGKHLLTAAGMTARLWDVSNGQPTSQPLTHRQELLDAAYSADGRMVATACADGTGGVWDVANKAWADESLRHGSAVLSVAFSPDSQWVVTSSDDNTARVWHAQCGGPRTPPLPHVGTVGKAVFSPDGRQLLSAGSDGLAKLWELPKAMPMMSAPPLSEGEPAVLSRDGTVRLVAHGSAARAVDAHTGVPLGPPLTHLGQISRVALSPDGMRAATAGADRVAHIWDWRTGAKIGEPLRHGSRVNDVVFSPDGGRVATGSDDNTARVWDAKTGEPSSPPLSLSGSVVAVRFNPDGKLLLAVTKGPYARVWDADGGEAVAVVSRNEPWVRKVLEDGTGPWKLPADSRPASELTAIAEWLSGHRVDSAGGLVPLDAAKLRQIGEQLRRDGATQLGGGPGNSTPR